MTPKFRILCYVCTDSMGHSAGARETLEMLDGMLDSFDHPEQSSTEQGRAGEQSCTLLGEMLDSFDQGLKAKGSNGKGYLKNYISTLY